jgi:hypothetical protein
MFLQLSISFHYSTAKQMLYVQKNKSCRSKNGSLAQQPCPAALSGSLAWQPCPAALPGSLTEKFASCLHACIQAFTAIKDIAILSLVYKLISPCERG